MLQQVMQEVIPRFPNIKFVWKTQNPAGCSFPQSGRLLHPENPIAAGIEISSLDSEEVYVTHSSHRQFWFRDTLALSQITPATSNVVPLDMRMLYSRTDAHVVNIRGTGGMPKDCLHFRSPGPLDVIPSLFQELLKNELHLS
jgi:hypothetical protein